MRARLRYNLTVSPRAPRRNAGLLVGLVISALVVPALGLAGIAADTITHAAAALVVAL